MRVPSGVFIRHLSPASLKEAGLNDGHLEGNETRDIKA